MLSSFGDIVQMSSSVSQAHAPLQVCHLSYSLGPPPFPWIGIHRSQTFILCIYICARQGWNLASYFHVYEYGVFCIHVLIAIVARGGS